MLFRSNKLETILEIGHAIARILTSKVELAQYLDFNYKDQTTGQLIAWQFVLHWFTKISKKVVISIQMHFSKVPPEIFNVSAAIKKALDIKSRTDAMQELDSKDSAEELEESIISFGEDLIALGATVDKAFSETTFKYPEVKDLADPLIKISTKKRKRQSENKEEPEGKKSKADKDKTK